LLVELQEQKSAATQATRDKPHRPTSRTLR
jgi:hypothetical protein